MKDYDLIIPAVDEDNRHTILMALGAALATAHSLVPEITANQMIEQGFDDYEDRKVIFEQMEHLLDYLSRILLKNLDDKGVELDETIVAPLRAPNKNVN
jgi:hypothetical protein